MPSAMARSSVSVVPVDVHVSLGLDRQVQRAVAGELLDHVGQKPEGVFTA